MDKACWGNTHRPLLKDNAGLKIHTVASEGKGNQCLTDVWCIRIIEPLLGLFSWSAFSLPQIDNLCGIFRHFNGSVPPSQTNQTRLRWCYCTIFHRGSETLKNWHRASGMWCSLLPLWRFSFDSAPTFIHSKCRRLQTTKTYKTSRSTPPPLPAAIRCKDTVANTTQSQAARENSWLELQLYYIIWNSQEHHLEIGNCLFQFRRV